MFTTFQSACEDSAVGTSRWEPFRMIVAFLVLCVLHGAAKCSAHKGARAATGSQSVTLQPWLTGLTAVVVFLFIVFILLIIKRLLKKNRPEENEQEDMFGYENKVVEMDDDDMKETHF
uniref:small integral membrane protein 24 isoform X2 n=1 Tax=Doryrhamphus excisus TaxID=161450 RepID=UPI0025AEA92A|nr:small integral membrane protein 24 isoform X2 [Doryrhamphus excisus]